MTNVLILGSGPNVVSCAAWGRTPFDIIVAINNAWSVRPDWDYLIHPDDFPADRQPQALTPQQNVIRSTAYVPIQNKFGGFVYAGGTMAFTAGYWALGALRPRCIAFIGCDMVYGAGQTHFYGKGTADPLRADVTLRSLQAKSARLMIKAAQAGCAMVNLSDGLSRLVFPRATPTTLPTEPRSFDAEIVASATCRETTLDYVVPSGKYWKEEARFDPQEIDALDALWLKSVQPL